MSEEPKSIWNKSIQLPQLLLVWLGLMVVATGICVAIMFVINSPFELFWLAIVGTVSAIVLLAGWIFVRWLCCRRNLKRSAFGLACLATLIALFYAEENWRGKRAWEQFKCEWETKGEKFDFASIIPPQVADDRNFAMTPLVATCYDYILSHDGKKIPYEKRNTNHINRLMFDLGDGDWKTNATGDWRKSTKSNLKLWQGRYREVAVTTNQFAVPPEPQTPAADVLLALSKYDATVEELRQAAQLPECRFPLDYDNECPAAILLPNLASMKSASQLLRLRAIAELENNQNEKACQDVFLSLRLISFLRSEPTLISHLVRIAMTDIVTQPVYEGLAAHRWTDAQLIAMDAELAKMDFLADYKFTMRCERAFSSAIIDYVSAKKRFQRYQELFDARWDENGNYKNEKKTLQAAGVYLMPSGWFDQNKLVIGRLHEIWLLRFAVPEEHQIFPQLTGENPLGGVKTSPFNFFAMEMVPSLTNSVKKFARGQFAVDLARTAIGLERYYLVHGNYPETLDALAPQFIASVPRDVFGGQPLKYRRNGDGQFILYSIGWNGRDDGGVTMIPKVGSQLRYDDGDWVWRYPAKN